MDSYLPDLSGQPSDEEVANLLSDRGWRQGTIFQAPGAEMSCIEKVQTGDGAVFAAAPRPTPSDGRFVVASQSCDIRAPLKSEPFVEALACDIESDPIVRADFTKSFRRFEIDPDEGLMANAAYRVIFDKRTLLQIEPEPWPGSSRRLIKFSDWLGRRTTRSAIPEPIVDAFVRPLSDGLRNLRKSQSDVYTTFNNIVAQIRMIEPESDEEPFDIRLIFVHGSRQINR